MHWAATAKRRDEWDRFSNLMSFVAASGFGGKWIDPRVLNPMLVEEDSEEKRHVETRMGFGLLSQHLKMLAESRR